MGEKLQRPPLVEAVCEFRFAEQDAWDWTVPGRLYELIRADFPERAQQSGMDVRVARMAGGGPVATLQPAAERVQLRKSDGSALVQVGPELLSINHLRPYPSWEAFLAMITNVLDAYRTLFAKLTLGRIGLRYINQMPLAIGSHDVANFLTVSPPLPGSLDKALLGFFQRYELEEFMPVGVLIHQTGTQLTPEGNPAIALDLDFVSQEVAHLGSTDSVVRWLESAHDRIYAAFVDSVNPTLLARLRKGEP